LWFLCEQFDYSLLLREIASGIAFVIRPRRMSAEAHRFSYLLNQKAKSPHIAGFFNNSSPVD